MDSSPPQPANPAPDRAKVCSDYMTPQIQDPKNKIGIVRFMNKLFWLMLNKQGFTLENDMAKIVLYAGSKKLLPLTRIDEALELNTIEELFYYLFVASYKDDKQYDRLLPVSQHDPHQKLIRP